MTVYILYRIQAVIDGKIHWGLNMDLASEDFHNVFVDRKSAEQLQTLLALKGQQWTLAEIDINPDHVGAVSVDGIQALL